MMNSIRIIRVIHNGTKILSSTNVRNASSMEDTLDMKKLEHYRHLNALDQMDVKPNGWNEAKPFKDIPGPKPLPLIGNGWRFVIPKLGSYFGTDFSDVIRKMHEDYGEIVILSGMPFRKPLVFIFNEKDIETLYRNEGVWPIREAALSSKVYRQTRKDLFKNTGLAVTHGEEWFKFRSMVNPILMQPRNVLQYVDQMNVVTDELIDNIKYFSEQNKDGEMPENFIIELYKWSLESIGVVTMDTHLGCLRRDAKKDSEPYQIIQYVMQMFDLMYKLDVLPSFWKIISTPNWKKFVKNQDFLTKTNLKYINQYIERIEKGEIEENETNNVLYKLVKLDRDLAIVMASDMLVGGVDTTGRVLGAALYFIAQNPKVQNDLRNEATTLLQTKKSPVTKEILAKAPYLKAVVKETLRFAPIAFGSLRTTVKNLVLGGYQIPKGTDLFTMNLLLCQKDEHYVRAKEFLPERWLSTTTGELSHKNTNAVLYAPFGNGPRSCVGKRLATLELETALLKILRNFELNWPHEDMVFESKLLYGIASPLKLHVKELDH